MSGCKQSDLRAGGPVLKGPTKDFSLESQSLGVWIGCRKVIAFRLTLPKRSRVGVKQKYSDIPFYHKQADP